MPQVRNTAEQFVSRIIPDTKAVVRTRPLEALIIGSYVRGLSDRDIESITVEAGLGQVSKTTVSRICRELRDRYCAFCSKSLADVSLLVLFLDAVYLPRALAEPPAKTYNQIPKPIERLCVPPPGGDEYRSLREGVKVGSRPRSLPLAPMRVTPRSAPRMCR